MWLCGLCRRWRVAVVLTMPGTITIDIYCIENALGATYQRWQDRNYVPEPYISCYTMSVKTEVRAFPWHPTNHITFSVDCIILQQYFPMHYTDCIITVVPSDALYITKLWCATLRPHRGTVICTEHVTLQSPRSSLWSTGPPPVESNIGALMIRIGLL